jgi:hypothetical protein
MFTGNIRLLILIVFVGNVKVHLSVHFLNLKQVNLMRLQMLREHAQIMKITNVFLSNFSLCSNQSNHKTEIDCLSFQQAFNVLISEKFPQYDDTFSSLLWHSNYNKFNKFINNEKVQCIVYENNSRSYNMVFKTVGEEKRYLLLKYFSFNKDI